MLKKIPNIRRVIIALLLISVFLLIGFFSGNFINESVDSHNNPEKYAKRIDQYFNNAIAYMKHKQYQQAVDEWRLLLSWNPEMPEAYVNLGFSLYETGEFQLASQNFKQAMNINPYQANAYFGLAICLEKAGDTQAASGAMRSYIHLSKKDDPFVRKAQSALWEWQSQMDRQVKNKN